jgi:hypothetical protein
MVRLWEGRHEDDGRRGLRGCFGWEYKSRGKDLKAAIAQLQRYAPALENPPLLVVCDLARIEIHTNWTNTVSHTCQIALGRSRRCQKAALAQMGLYRPGPAEAWADPADADRASGSGIRPARATSARPRPPVAGRRAFHQPARLLHVRRGCRSIAQQNVTLLDTCGSTGLPGSFCLMVPR